MAGQGGPNIGSGLRRGQIALGLVLCALAISSCLIAEGAAAEEVDVRLRIAWGGGEPRPWQGTIQISGGAILEVTPLGLEADAPGSMLPVDYATIRVLPRTPRTYDGCDLRVQAPLEAKLLVHLWAGDAPRGEPVELPLEKLLRTFVQFDIDDQNNRMLGQRAPGDALRVSFDRDGLVFAPGEQFEIEVAPNAAGLAAGGAYLLSASLSPGRGEQHLWDEERDLRVDASGKAPPTVFRIAVPMGEGVYDLRLSVYPKRLGASLLRGKPLVTRKVQFVAVAPVKTIVHHSAEWQSVVEFDPAAPRWWERMTRLPSWTRLPNLPQHPVFSGNAGTRSHLGRAWVELGPLGWNAYPLSIAAPDVPHVLEVEYPSDVEQTLAISVIEPGATGKVGPIGLDSGIDVPTAVVPRAGQVRRHRLLFWPQTKAPYVLLVNRRDDAPAVFGKIQVQAGPVELPPLTITQPNFATRTLAAYYDKPLVAENFSAAEALDPASGRSFDDWVTFYEAGQRLVQTLLHTGYNAVVLTAACEGSAIYPSRLLEPTPRYDTGVFFESGQDPLRKDVLELWMRLCDRNGIQLIPAVQFAAPLPELEALRQAGGKAIGIEPLGPDGLTWLQRNGGRRGMGAWYNALDERVQRAMVSVVAELAERYAHHPSFGGVAVQLAGDSFALLPDETCSYDDVTIGRFVRETGTDLPAPTWAAAPGGAGPGDPSSAALILAARAAHLQGAVGTADGAAAAWQKWRAAQLTNLYKAMRQEVVQRRATARLYLTTAGLMESPRLRLALRPTLPPRADPAGAVGTPDSALAALGLDLEKLAQEGIVVPRPQRIVPASYGSLHDLERHWNVDARLDALFVAGGKNVAPRSLPRGGAAGGAGTPDSAAGTFALHFLEPAPLRLPEFDEASPFGRDKTRTLLISQIVPADEAQRERFVRSLMALDAPLMIDGGWLLPLGQEASLAPLVKVYRRLPAEPFEPARPAAASPGSQEVVVRTLMKGGKTYFYALNPAPWPVTVRIEFQMPRPVAIVSYAQERPAQAAAQAGRVAWTVKMEAFDLVGGEIPTPDAKVVDWQVTTPTEVGEALQRRIRDVRLKTNALRPGAPLAPGAAAPVPLANPSFEAPAAEQAIPGWVTARGGGIVAEVDRTQGYQSQSSLHLASRPDSAAPAGGYPAPIVWARSEPILPRKTGRLRLVALMRVADEKRQPKLRLAMEWIAQGRVYYKRANVGQAEQADTGGVMPLGTKWTQVSFPLDELPLSGLSELRVGFDLMGEGEVWIDEVRVYDLWFEPAEYDELLKSVATAESQLRSGHWNECLAFADGFWPRLLGRYLPAAAQNAAISGWDPGPPAAAPAARPVPGGDSPRAHPARRVPGREAAPNLPSEVQPEPQSATTWQRLRGWMPAWPKWR